MLVLGLEGTAHTFGAGIIRRHSDGTIDILASKTRMHRPEAGGIHPREAANHHAAVGPDVLAEALDAAGIRASELDLVAFSRAPGLGPCLRTVATIARAFALTANKPLIGVNHCVAHLEIGCAVTPATDPVLLYASGGNTQIIAFTQGRYRVFGETLDIGVGNMLDKFAREEGHPFPGGPEIERIARDGTRLLPMPYSIKGMDVAFSGILTAARAHRAKGETMPNVCMSLQETAFAMLVEVTERALAHTGKTEVVMGGGVACNDRLWDMTRTMCEERGATAHRPEKRLLVDNGAMIALLGAIQHQAGIRHTLPDTTVDQRERTDEIPVTWRTEPPRRHTRLDNGTRGAEARVDITTFLGRPAIQKTRTPKTYRHPELDATLRTTRTRTEARLLSEARQQGVRTPILHAIETDTLILERLDDTPLKRILDDQPERAPTLLTALGQAAARLHAHDLVHGDLTTSNVLAHEQNIALIDFGLATLNAEDEDKGADLHVLMESLEATHATLPQAFHHALTGYQQAGGSDTIIRKVEEIVRRGRYRGT